MVPFIHGKMDSDLYFNEHFKLFVTNDDIDHFRIKMETNANEAIDIVKVIKKAIHCYSITFSNNSILDEKYFHCILFKEGIYNSIYIEIDTIETADESINFIDVYCYSNNNILIGKGSSLVQNNRQAETHQRNGEGLP